MLGEVTLRCLGYTPFRHVVTDLTEPVTHLTDPTLGWRNRPGSYRYKHYDRGEEDVKLTILRDGSRATADRPSQAATPTPGLIFLGGSFTRGTAISDTETFAWKLQTRFSDTHVRNFGTGGYGTYQSLQLLESLPPAQNIRAVIYGYITEHRRRNVGGWQWLQVLSRYSRRGHVSLPFVSMSANGELVRHSPIRYPTWPLHRSLATVALAQQVFAQLTIGNGEKAQDQILRHLLHALNRVARQKFDAPLVVVFLNATDWDRHHLKTFFKENDILYADCAYPIPLSMVVKGEGQHPNGHMHTVYANCIAEMLNDFL